MKQQKYILQVDDYDTNPLALFDTIEEAKKYANDLEPDIELEWTSKVENTADAHKPGYYGGRMPAYFIYPVDYFPSEV